MKRISRASSILLLFLLFLHPIGLAHKQGIGQQADNGCVCHGAERELKTQAYIDGLPERFNSSQTYNLTLWMNSSIVGSEGSQGGFMLWHSAGVSSGENDVQEMEGRLTHTEQGNAQRGWMIQWTAPEEDDIQVDFQLYVNAVNGNNDVSGDAWGSKVLSIAGQNYSGDLKDAKVPGEESGFIPFLGATATVAILALAARRLS